MKVIKDVKSLKEELSFLKNHKIGFVPTMGALHAGHLSLIETAKSQCDYILTSIFINPTQFDNQDDFKNYPITIDKDINHLKNIKTDMVFCPNHDDLYKFEKPFYLELNGLDQTLEGSHRKGHFDGVLRVVNLFFSLINPNYVYFGEKDYQQYLIINELCKKYYPSISVIPCPTVRETSGLAKSSRNSRLTEKQRTKAARIFKVLSFCRDQFKISNLKELESICFKMISEFSDPEYFKIRNTTTLSSEIIGNEKYRAFVATKLCGVRLIDYLAVN